MKYKILAVDDNPINTKLLSRALVDSSYELFTASSGKEALELAARHKPDLVLLDVMMPEMDGYEVCRRLQENEETAHTQVIFLSAKNESVDKARGLALGAIDYLTKPFDVMEINARIRNHLKINERNIRLNRKIQELEEQLRQKNESADSQANTRALPQLMDKMEQDETDLDKKHYKLHSCVQSNEKPTTALFYPHPVDDDHLLYFSFSGLDKDYPTAMLKLLMQKFLQGFTVSMAPGGYSTEALSALVNGLMDVFPDDIFDVAYTFALSYLDLSASVGYFYLLHQNTPLWLHPDGRWNFLEGETLAFKSPYSTLVKAVQADLPSDGMLFYYQNGLQKLPDSFVEEKLLPCFKAHWPEPAETLHKLKEQLPQSEDDRLLAAISVIRPQ